MCLQFKKYGEDPGKWVKQYEADWRGKRWAAVSTQSNHNRQAPQRTVPLRSSPKNTRRSCFSAFLLVPRFSSLRQFKWRAMERCTSSAASDSLDSAIVTTRHRCGPFD